MFEALQNHDDLERTDENTMPNTFREYETDDGFTITLNINQTSKGVLVKLWDNVEDSWKQKDEHLLARGKWLSTDRAESVALDMYDGRLVLQEIQNNDATTGQHGVTA